MKLSSLDWLIIAAYFALSLAVGLYYARRAGRSTEEFFLSNRSMPWWLAGTSMVATTFAADTPPAVTEMVARDGVAGNWLWWSMLAGGMLTVFFFARLWRRALVMTDYLPVGWRGLPLASFAAAYMSTISTQMNWGSSYLVNDFYRRFVRRGATERHYVLASRLATLLVVLLSVAVTYYTNRITGGWELVMALGAGTGLVYILRWYWWRVNAWSEVSSMAAALAVSLSLRYFDAFDSSNPQRVRAGHPHDGRRDGAGVGGGHAADGAGAGREARRVLPEGAAGGAGLASGGAGR